MPNIEQDHNCPSVAPAPRRCDVLAIGRALSGAVLAPTGEETSPVVAEPIRGARR
jgi:hypothetical protein